MLFRSTKAYRLLALSVGMLVFNISTNLNDSLIGKAGPGYKYVNEIETVVELVAEVLMQKGDFLPENQLPGGTLGFEEEEKHLQEEEPFLEKPYISNTLYKKNIYHTLLSFRDHIAEVPTPPPDNNLFSLNLS